MGGQCRWQQRVPSDTHMALPRLVHEISSAHADSFQALLWAAAFVAVHAVWCLGRAGGQPVAVASQPLAAPGVWSCPCQP